MDWDAEPVSSAGLLGRLRDPAVTRGVQRVERTQSVYAHLNVVPAGFSEDERRRENDERAGTGRRKKKKKKSKGSNLQKENIMSVLFGTDDEEEQVSPGGRAREGLERDTSLAIATTAALPPERPELRAARGEERRGERKAPCAPRHPRGKSAVGRRQWHATAEQSTRGSVRAGKET